MTWHRAWKGFVAPRTTVSLLVVLAALCLMMVVVPQRRTVGDAAIEAMATPGSWRSRLLVGLGLSDLPTSPLFLAMLALFFLQLGTVLVARVRPTLARIALRPLSEKGLVAWARLEESLRTPVPEGFDGGRAARALRDAGYRARRVGDATFWGVRHRTAPLGFLLFHASFFLIAAGGAWLFYTRFDADAVLSEGQSFGGYYSSYRRQPPAGQWPQLRFTLLAVDPRFAAGEVAHLEASLLLGDGPGAVERRTEVNRPAQWGIAKLFVRRAGLAPVVWLQDADGFTLDRVTVPVGGSRSREPTELTLGEERYRARFHPLPAGTSFPERGERSRTPLRFELLDAASGNALLDVKLTAGEAAEFEGGRLVVSEMRYWAVIQVVAERGGGLLIAGFALGIVGIVWRLWLHRREVAVTWDEQELRLVGRSEYFSRLFRRELEEILGLLVATPPADGRARASSDGRPA